MIFDHHLFCKKNKLSDIVEDYRSNNDLIPFSEFLQEFYQQTDSNTNLDAIQHHESYLVIRSVEQVFVFIFRHFKSINYNENISVFLLDLNAAVDR